MKILVRFEQEFFTNDKSGEKNLNMIETTSQMFEASSDREFLEAFDSWDFVPFHLRRLTSKFIHSGKKTMLWYLPESFQPHIKE